MALLTKCPSPGCNSTFFELATNTKVEGSAHRFFFVQCKLCGTAISAIDARQDELIAKMARKLGVG
ncbi:hypothetical protein GCM10009413_05060 [Tatumella punctata]